MICGQPIPIFPPLATLRHTLLPKQLSGELSVAGLDSQMEIPS